MLRVTPTLRKQINETIRQHASGGRPRAEVAERQGRENGSATNNGLLWRKDPDLRRLSDLREIDDDPERPGKALLDCYVYSIQSGFSIRHGETAHWSLERNVHVLVDAGQVVAAFDDWNAAEEYARQWES
jgi:hypothetical protein